MKTLIVGGSSGIGLSIMLNLIKRKDMETVYIIDKKPIPQEYLSKKVYFVQMDLSAPVNHKILDEINDISSLYITAGFGHLNYFQDLDCTYIENSFAVNVLAPIEIIYHYYDRFLDKKSFYCGVMVSIAGRLNSPMFSIYSATKAALSRFIEAVNVELEVQGSNNRILEVSPGAVKGTSFSGEKTDPSQTAEIASEIIDRAEHSDRLYIPQYEDLFKDVIARYTKDPHKFGIESYLYKLKRINRK